MFDIKNLHDHIIVYTTVLKSTIRFWKLNWQKNNFFTIKKIFFCIDRIKYLTEGHNYPYLKTLKTLNLSVRMLTQKVPFVDHSNTAKINFKW